jgi:nitroimidazol reductase NimA-like FMN-containing flavoprotein (pyridoxamine 5'-phosphate oxidase superfamily)
MTTTRHDLPNHECISLLDSETVGRLCVIDHGYPLAFPVNYRVLHDDVGDRIVFRTSPTASMSRYEGLSSLEVDSISTDRQRAWSVIARGRLRRSHGEADLPDTHPLVAAGRYQWLVLDVSSISGRRFLGTPVSDRFSVDWQTVDA